MDNLAYTSQQLEMAVVIQDEQSSSEIIISGIGTFAVPARIMQMAYAVDNFNTLPTDNQARVVLAQMLRVAEQSQ